MHAYYKLNPCILITSKKSDLQSSHTENGVSK